MGNEPSIAEAIGDSRVAPYVRGLAFARRAHMSYNATGGRKPLAPLLDVKQFALRSSESDALRRLAAH